MKTVTILYILLATGCGAMPNPHALSNTTQAVKTDTKIGGKTCYSWESGEVDCYRE